jgi:PmbA protein
VHAERSGLARFAASDVHQPTLVENVVTTVRLVRDGKVGAASSNRVDDDGLEELARRAGEVADAARADPDWPGLTPPAALPPVDAFDPELADLDADEQARLARAAIDAVPELELYGFFTSGVSELAVATSTGIAAHQTMTDATVLAIAAADGASGYAEQTSWRAAGVDPAGVAREAAEKAARTRGAAAADPGHYRAVLEPYALAELLVYFAWDSFSGQGVLEERSYVGGRLGEKVFDERLSISDDALDPAGLPKAFDFEGSPKRRVELVTDGVARGVVWDRATAAKSGDGAATTGHAPPAPLRPYGPVPFALAVAPGDAESAEALAGRVDDGIYVTRLHYLSVVDPREGVVTGMTRDGTFRIRDGRIAEPLMNLRFTVSVPEVLSDVLGLTSDMSLINASDFYGERYPTATLCPALATGRFNITGNGSGPGL